MNARDVLSTIREWLAQLGERLEVVWQRLAEIEFERWPGAIRGRIAAIDFEGWMETVRAGWSQFEFSRLAAVAPGGDADPALRLAAGALAVGALGTAVLLTLRMMRQRRGTVLAPAVALVAAGDPDSRSVIRVMPRRARAPRRPTPSRSERIERVGRLANHGATQAQVARAIGLSRDALAILAPAVDWSRAKLPRPARSSADEHLGVSMQRRFTRRIIG